MGRKLAGKRHTPRVTRFDDPSQVGSSSCQEEMIKKLFLNLTNYYITD